jgi:hypothetical protein
MSTTYMWIAADRHGRLAKMSAEHGGVFPKDVAFLHDGASRALVGALHEAWVEHVAPRLVLGHNDLVHGRSGGPMLVVFDGETPTYGRGTRVGPNTVRFDAVPEALRAQVEAALAREDAGEADPPGTPKILGSIGLDAFTFADSEHEALFTYARWGELEAYRRGAAPRVPLVVGTVPTGVEGITTLDVDFATDETVDLRAALPRERLFDDLAGSKSRRR